MTMPRTGRRIQVQFPPDLENEIFKATKEWSPTGENEPLTFAQVVRECIRYGLRELNHIRKGRSRTNTTQSRS